jgi:TrmH family RNA methyltransferase
MITSLRNDKVRLVRSLQDSRRLREREGLFVVEGVRLCGESALAGVVPYLVMFTQPVEHEMPAAELISIWREAGVPCHKVSESIMAACSDTETPQGLLAVIPLPSLPFPESPTLTLVLDQLRDPGNLGTILRTALAAGVELVLLPPGTVDATNPKVVRAGAGAHFHLPIAAMGWDDISDIVRGGSVYLAAADGDETHTAVDWTASATLIVGGEAAGAGERAHALAAKTISIPMQNDVESLNAAIATAVILFEAARQRRS